MNKGGQSGISFSGVLWILAAVLLAIGIFTIVQVSDAGQSLGKNVPSKLEAVGVACSIAAENGLTEGYCNQPRPIDKRDKIWVTCQHAVANEGVVLDIKDRNNIPSCNQNTVDKRIAFYAEEYSLGSNDYVNGKLVSSYTGDLTAKRALEAAVTNAQTKLTAAEAAKIPEDITAAQTELATANADLAAFIAQ